MYPQINSDLRKILLEAYRPCSSFTGDCRDMRWHPKAGHIPRGFCGATGILGEVKLVLVVAEPGDPHESETHPENAEAAIDSAYAYAYECFRKSKDLFHANVRRILDMCWPGLSFDEQMRCVWITESVLCSAKLEGGSVSIRVGKACRGRYLEHQLTLFPRAVVAALGSKARSRMSGLPFIAAGAVAPPGCNRKEVQESWNAIAQAVKSKSVSDRVSR